MTDNPAFTSFAPGFEFLQGLVKNAGAAMPGMGQWVAPTLNPEELDKRIQELRTVQFWLEQNARMLGATIQALEVQKMTLTTLQTMNVQMSDLRDAAAARSAAGFTQPSGSEAPKDTPAKASEAAVAPDKSADSTAAQADSKPAIDPMQWWGALTQQFSELAATALKDSAAEAAALVASAAVVPEAKAKAKKASRSEPPSGQPVARKAASRSASRGAAASPRKPAARTPR
jgi:hypothetical protein